MFQLDKYRYRFLHGGPGVESEPRDVSGAQRVFSPLAGGPMVASAQMAFAMMSWRAKRVSKPSGEE